MNCNTDTMKMRLYTYLVHSHLEYTCAIWSPHAGGAITKLESVQNFGLSVASHKWSACYKDLVVELSIPTLERKSGATSTKL